jgi:MerR family transcriptional regulator, thiopeptide resistance regulator
MEWSIVDIARIAGTTSRTLRHYGDVGLLAPSRIGANGYRYYNEDALVRLQRILLLRELGLGIPAIVEVIEGERDGVDALTIHLGLLEQQKRRLDRQIASVEQTVMRMKGRQQLMPEEMFDGFDHTAYKEEVETTWGADAYQRGDRWWRSKSAREQSEYRAQHKAIAADYQAARDRQEPADGAVVQAIVARHVDWLNLTAEITGGEISAQRLRYYGDMYVGDPRFAANYGGLDGAEFVREAFGYYAEHALA